MKIGILNYYDSTVDIVTVDKEYISSMYNGDVYEFLTEVCGYDPGEYHWITDIKGINIIDNDDLNQTNV